MHIHGLPENFWVVTQPTPVSELNDICFACTFGRLMLQALGGLAAADIVGIFADENEAKKLAEKLLGEKIVRVQDAVAVEVLVHMAVRPIEKDLTLKALLNATLESVENAVRRAEQMGFEHQLAGKISLGAGPVELHNQIVAFG
jgi:hypothetical protein